MTWRRLHIAVLCLSSALGMNLHVQAQESATGSKRHKGIVRFVEKVGEFIDSMSVKGLDRNYIDAPEKPWQIIVQGNLNQTELKMKAIADGYDLFGEGFGDITLTSRMRTSPSSYVGLWAGYRGYGIGYSRNVAGDRGSIFKIGATGGAYGVNLRIHSFEDYNPSLAMSGMMQGYRQELVADYFLISPIRARTVIFDGYYLFNGKRFSYAAAYDQSVIQKRSAGSLMAGLMFYHSRINFDNDTDPDFILFMEDTGRIKQNQLSIGAGYAYNLVPHKRVLVNVMAMPTLTLYNQIIAWKYDSKMRQALIEQRKNPDAATDSDDDLCFIWETGKETSYSHPTLNFDSRLSVTYNADSWFLNINGQFNTFFYHHGRSKGRLNDWLVNVSVGARL